MSELFFRLYRTVLTIFTGRNLAWQGLAVGLTVIILMSGLDWGWYRWTRSAVMVGLAGPGIILGSLVPILGTGAILLAGWVSRERGWFTTGCALGQAAGLGFLISSVLKAFTGRRPPPFAHHFREAGFNSAGLVDTSHGFQLGFLRGGVFWGWPSGHTTVAFAMTTCLMALFPRARPATWLLLIYPFYVGLGVSVTIHWLSEFVAGAIMGSVVGTVVGRSFRERLGHG